MKVEQSTPGLWPVDLVRTAKVEMNGSQKVDTTDAASIKAQREGDSTHQPESPLTTGNMPPQTRAQSKRSRGPSSLPTVEENISLDGAGPIPQLPTKTNRAADEERDRETFPTTLRRGKIAASVNSEQREAARDADPNEGRCLLTNRPTEAGVQLCHVVPRSTKPKMLGRLEYVWGLEPNEFNLHTKYNMIYLRADWHILFDKPKWILVPEVTIIEELSDIYLKDRLARSTVNLSKRFATESGFRYYMVPEPSLQEVLCRFPIVKSHNHDTYEPPFATLGPLTSHMHPHYVVFNAGQKLSKFAQTDITRMRLYLSKILQTDLEDMSPLDNIQDLYGMWMRAELPAEWHARGELSGSDHTTSEAGEDSHPKGGHPPKRRGLRSETRSQDGTQSSMGQYEGGRQKADLPLREDSDSSSVTDDTFVEDDTAWIEFIRNWQKQGEDATKLQEPDLVNNTFDQQLAAYHKEHARTPPSPGGWHS